MYNYIYIYVLINISKHETQSLYPSLLHPRDSKPSSFGSATVCGSACPGGRLRGYPAVTGSATCLKKIVRVAANQRHSSNMDCKQTSVWPSTKKSAIVDMWKVSGTLLLVMLAPCIILRIPRSSSRMSCSIRQAINNSDGPGGKVRWKTNFKNVEAFPTLLSDFFSTIRDVKIHEVIISKLFWIWIQHSLRQVSRIPFSPKGQTGPRSHQALHGLFADLQWWPASARPWKAKTIGRPPGRYSSYIFY